MLNTLWPYVLALFQIAGIALALKAVRTARTPQGAVGWVAFLVVVPYIAVPAYLFLGHTRLPAYLSARRVSKSTVRALEQLRHVHAPHLEGGRGAEDGSVAAFERLADMPVVSGNAAELLIDGDSAFSAMFEAIESARSYVLIAFYILRADDLGREFKDRVLAKAREGVRVRILYDAVGGQGLPRAYRAELRAAGIEIEGFHAIRLMQPRFRLNFRNHRKIVIVDGQVAFCGGLNVGDEYMGRSARFGRWRDTNLRLRGPVVAQMQLVFAEDWHWIAHERLQLDWEPEPAPENIDALILAPGPADPMETGSLYFCNALGRARRRIWIASPYFVPDVDVLGALKLAALRGVDVRILVADKRDHLIVWVAAFAFFDEARAAGVKIFRYSRGFMHQKVVLVDDDFAAVGSINLNNRSCRLDFEVQALIFDRDFAGRVAAMLEADFADSYRYDTPLDQSPSLLRRYGAPVARLFAPIL